MLRAVLIVIGIVLSSTSALAASPFKRVLIVSESENFPEAAKARLLESWSRAMQRGFNKALGSAVYGTGSAFKPQQVQPPLKLLMSALQHADRYLEEDVATRRFMEGSPVTGRGILRGPFMGGKVPAEMANLPDGYGQVMLEVMYVPASLDLPPPPAGSFAEKVRQSALGATAMFLDLAKLGGTPEDFNNGLALYDQIEGISVVDDSDSWRIYDAARTAYDSIVKDDNLKWFPVYLRQILIATDRDVTLDVTAILKPGSGLGGDISPSAEQVANMRWQEKVMGVTTLDYVPHLSYSSTDYGPAAMRLAFKRTYGDGSRPIVHVQFGRLGYGDIRMFLFCRINCQRELTVGNIGIYHPTINGQFRFEHIPYTNSVLVKAIKGVANRLGGKDTFRVLLQDLAIRIDPEGLMILPGSSAMTVGVGTSGNVIQINQVNNISIMGMDANMFGFDLYSQIAPDLSAALSVEANNAVSLTNLESNATNAAVIKAVAPIGRLFF